MGNPEAGSQRQEYKEGQEGFLITFPDGSTGRFKNRAEAMQAMQDWREAK